MILLAADLDRTLIYSRTAARLGDPAGRAELVTVEHHKGEPASFMTVTAAGLLARLPVVPVTTRSLKQYGRVRLPGPVPAFAVAGNGGHLLLNGEPDPLWAKHIEDRLGTVAALPEAIAELRRLSRPEWRVREVDGLFTYAVLERATSARPVLAELQSWADGHGWTVSLQGRKLYLVPAPLTKSAAVAEIVGRTGAHTVLAAGDSLLDRDLLGYAHAGVHPGHGELAESGWTAPHVRRLSETGALAGQRIVEWFAAALS
jgi:hypothetical protein